MAISDFFTPQAVGRSEYNTSPPNALADQVASQVRDAVAEVMVGSLPYGAEYGEHDVSPPGQSPSFGNPFGGMNNGQDLSRAGTVGGMFMGAPGMSLAGNALGSYMDVQNANAAIAQGNAMMGTNVAPMGLQQGLSSFASNTPLGWLGIGTPVGTAYRDAMAQAAMTTNINNPMTQNELAILSGGPTGANQPVDVTRDPTSVAEIGFLSGGGSVGGAGGGWDYGGQGGLGTF